MLWGLQPGSVAPHEDPFPQLNPPPQVSGKGNSRGSRIPAGVRALSGLPAAAHLPQEATAWFRGGTRAGSERSGSRGRDLYPQVAARCVSALSPSPPAYSDARLCFPPNAMAHFRGAGLPATRTSPEPMFLCRPPLPDVYKAGPGCEEGGCSVF